jgi:hypothetical protein
MPLALTTASACFRSVMPAGLKYTVVASSAAVAVPAKAVPSLLALCSSRANPDAFTTVGISAKETVAGTNQR